MKIKIDVDQRALEKRLDLAMKDIQEKFRRQQALDKLPKSKLSSPSKVKP